MEIKINDDGTVLIDGAVYRKDAEVKADAGNNNQHKVVNDNPLFYPKKGEDYAWLSGKYSSFLTVAINRISANKNHRNPKLRPETAQRVACGVSRLAEWQAMGVGIGEEGEERWYVVSADCVCCRSTQESKASGDALFLTKEDVVKALKEFGWERLKAARLARWGK